MRGPARRGDGAGRERSSTFGGLDARPGARAPRRGPRARRAPPAQPECDELPSEEEERRAKLPPLTALGKALPAEPWSPPPYEVLPGVTLPAKIAAKIEQIDRGYARRTREHLVITSGTRDANRQARAMFTKLRLGEDLLQLYRNKAAVQEIKKAYQANASKPPEQAVAAMEAVIQDQIDRGIYISAHLRRGAVDVRNRTMSPKEKRAFLESAAEVGGVLVIEESTPPHDHLQIDGTVRELRAPTPPWLDARPLPAREPGLMDGRVAPGSVTLYKRSSTGYAKCRRKSSSQGSSRRDASCSATTSAPSRTG